MPVRGRPITNTGVGTRILSTSGQSFKNCTNRRRLHIDMLKGTVANPTRNQLDTILQEALKMTFELFEADL